MPISYCYPTYILKHLKFTLLAIIIIIVIIIEIPICDYNYCYYLTIFFLNNWSHLCRQTGIGEIKNAIAILPKNKCRSTNKYCLSKYLHVNLLTTKPEVFSHPYHHCTVFHWQKWYITCSSACFGLSEKMLQSLGLDKSKNIYNMQPDQFQRFLSLDGYQQRWLQYKYSLSSCHRRCSSPLTYCRSHSIIKRHQFPFVINSWRLRWLSILY